MQIIPDFKDRQGLWVTDCRTRGERIVTTGYMAWRSMLDRCSPKGWIRKPSACGSENHFKDFQEFADWYVAQPGYQHPRPVLDKDLLVPGNKVYSRTTCVVLPHPINAMIPGDVRRNASVVRTASGKYIAQAPTGLSGKRYLGVYGTEAEALQASLQGKVRRMREVADEYQLFLCDQALDALRNYGRRLSLDDAIQPRRLIHPYAAPKR